MRLVRSDRHVLSELKEKLKGKLFACDFETLGVNWMTPGFWIRCVSFHNDDLSLSVELADEQGVYYPYAAELFEWLSEQRGIIAHNAGYETGCIYAMTGAEVTPYACTYALLGALANEGGLGQSWGLKQAAPELIGWDKWDQDVKGDKANMALLPFEQLGTYNQLDSAATWEIFKLCGACVEEHQDTWGPNFWPFHQEEMMMLVDMQNEAYREGLPIDMGHLPLSLAAAEQGVVDAYAAFYNDPEIAPHVNFYNAEIVRQAELSLASRPDKVTSMGRPSVNYSKAEAKLESMRGQMHFNIGSTDDLRWLIYGRMGIEATQMTEGGKPATDADTLATLGTVGRLLLACRDAEAQRRFLLGVEANVDEGRLRVSVKIPGTYTGRCSAGSLEKGG